jgi:hypothetical protein
LHAAFGAAETQFGDANSIVFGAAGDPARGSDRFAKVLGVASDEKRRRPE